MAVRRWRVFPDLEVPTDQYGPVLVVSREALVEALLDGATMLDRTGGVLTVVVDRHPTDLPGEMLTTRAVVEWKDRTDARPQPEQAVQSIPAPRVSPSPAEALGIAAALQAGDEIRVEDGRVVTGAPSPDGLDESTLEEEDVASLPEQLRR